MLSPSQLPVIDISTLVAGEPAASVAREIGNACRQQGFFYIVGHGVDIELQEQLEHLSREFFHLDLEAKMAIRMELSGRAWRGFGRKRGGLADSRGPPGDRGNRRVPGASGRAARGNRQHALL